MDLCCQDHQTVWYMTALLCVACPCEQVFNDQQTFSEWFTRFLGTNSDGKPQPSGGGGPEASAMDREKRILVVNRLHQILSPFMLRRMVSFCDLTRCLLGDSVVQHKGAGRLALPHVQGPCPGGVTVVFLS
jgi:hypothetical protein